MNKLVESALVGLITSMSVMGCGPATPPPNDGDDATMNSGSRSSSNGEGMTASGTIGGLDKNAVQGSVNKAIPKVSRCIDDGRRRLRYLGGAFEIHVDVNGMGQASSAYLLSSTLGEHQAEACVIEAFRSTAWPRPVGGEVGQLTQSLDYAAGGVDVPVAWTEEQLAEKMAADGSAIVDLQTQLDKCRNDAGAGGLSVTMYLDEDGLVQAVGLATGDEKRDEALSCVEAVVKTTSFPSPIGSFAKVTMKVR